jgi:hypothetical protein
MAKFLVIRDTYISHVGKTVRAGEEVEFEIPKVKVDGKLVPMTISDNLERLDKPAKGNGKPEEPLA